MLGNLTTPLEKRNIRRGATRGKIRETSQHPGTIKECMSPQVSAGGSQKTIAGENLQMWEWGDANQWQETMVWNVWEKGQVGGNYQYPAREPIPETNDWHGDSWNDWSDSKEYSNPKTY